MKTSYSQMSLIVALLGSLGLTACGKNDKSDVRSAEEFRLEPKNGELSKSLNEILKDQWAEDCDRQLSAKASELVTVFDLKADEIAAFAKTIKTTNSYQTVPFGDSFLKEYLNPPAPNTNWDTYSESWGEAYADYLAVKDQPMNRNWIYVNNEVRSVIVNDQMRVIDGMNMDLRHDSGPMLESLNKKLEDCLKDNSCRLPNLEPEYDWIQKIEFYRYAVKKINSLDFNAARDALGRFAKRVANDYRRYQFRVNPSVTAKTDAKGIHVITLPLEGSSFSEPQRAQLQSYIESIWMSDLTRVAVEWRNFWTDSIFKVFFDSTQLGTRAYVSWSDREMHLYPLTNIRSVAHESGHVLGFRDHYYTTWDSKRCVYHTEYNEADLMSDSYAGVVSSDEWAELKKQYPAKN